MPHTATDSCFDHEPPMLDVEQAIAELLKHALPLDAREHVDLMDTAGRVLAQDLTSPIDVPGFDNSAMDGYALRACDIETAQRNGLEIVQRIPAGRIGVYLLPGCAARIFTGAPVPEGADTVVMQEHCRVEEDRLFVEHAVNPGANIRPRGNDITAGNTILHTGVLLKAAHIGLAASVGITGAEVYRRLRVAMFSTGDELVEPGNPLGPGQIYNSNRYQLTALLRAQGCTVVDLGTVADTFAATRETLLQAAGQADLVITTGGVSVGEEDHVKAALESVGELTLWRIRMKPGKPLAFGRIGATPFIGLPGNPVSVFVTFLLFARPFLQTLQGRTVIEPHTFPVHAGFAYSARQRREYVRVRLSADPEHGLVAETFPRQGSDVMSSLAWSDGLVKIAENSKVQVGDSVVFLPFAEWAP
jgi:molybdopterin molybdotransferase